VSGAIVSGRTVAEKILSAKAGRPVRAGDLVIVDVDAVMASDTTAPLALEAFAAMGGERPFDPRRTILVIDHAAPAPNERIGSLHAQMRAFARKTGCVLHDAGEGICHQLVIEHGHVRPGDLFLGADSHSCTYGAIAAFGTGVGSTDLAAAMLTGQTWLKVPETIRIVVDGALPAGSFAKDLTLAIVGALGLAGATYRAIEFAGDAVAALDLAGRMTLANMAIEMGAKAGLVDPRGLDLSRYVSGDGDVDLAPLTADEGASYVRTLRIDARTIKPRVSLPHAPDKVASIDEAVGRKIDYAFLGTCVNGRLEDLHVAAEILRGKKVAPHVRFVIAPASRAVLLAAMRDGSAATLTEAGATFLPSGCGPCVGTHNGVPGDGEVVISTGNRNFVGRMGNPRADVYLGSPAAVAAAALVGSIVDPTPYHAERAR
jgi:3-isopropylmalate/(R)-2-methylmalate dehydratase large subunit